MSTLIDLTGQRFGRLVVVGRNQSRNNRRHVAWDCVCDCGNTCVVLGCNLKTGKTQSCGCLRNPKHVKSRERLYPIWYCMIQRCTNPTDSRYHRYGARGISVCEEWANDYRVFREWAYANGYKDDVARGQCTIDRIDIDGDYCPENCRWVDNITQCNNKSSNRYVTFKGETHTISEWSKITGINYGTLKDRILKNGWTIEDALTKSPDDSHNKKKMIEYQGHIYTTKELADITGKSQNTILYKLRNGWGVDRILASVPNEEELI